MTDTLNHMADTINLGKVGTEIESLHRAIDDVSVQVGSIDQKTDRLEKTLDAVQKELTRLTVDFQKMVEDQAKTAVLQKAISELVRVRQEIGQKYGNYSVIRETMLGVIQATDAALVKKNTISRVSEELMLSTPDYWLAPCLVAVSAWISNDRNLAERAISEAMKRDEEKTALAMALICRRNGRIETGYEWLSIYFANQNASSITEETFTYIDAYVNGVFGPDEKHMCQGYVAKWIDEIRGNRSNFEAAQEEKWENYCKRFKIDVKRLYPDLADTASEFSQINASIGSVRSYETIRNNFRGIKEAFVDQDTMKKTVDSALIRLISHYDKAEIEIRREEEYLSLVKFFEGDEDKAKKEMLVREAKRQQHKLDFIEQMSSEITENRDTAPSKRRTAVTFLSSYINRGYTKYIDKAKESFPTVVSLKVDQWHGTSADGTELDQLSAEYERKMNEVREDEVHRAASVTPRAYLIAAIVLAVIGVAALVLAPQFLIPAGASVAAGVILLIVRHRMLKNTEERIARINREFGEKIAAGKIKLDSSLRQWREVRGIMNQYNDEGEHKVA